MATLHDHYKDRTHATEAKDLEIFKAIADLLKCLQKVKYLVRPHVEWYHSFCPSFSIPLSYDPSQALDDASAIERALAVRRILKPVHGAVTEVSKWIAIQYYTCEQQVKFLKLRSGFMSLPDEILSVVLEFAADQQHEDDEHKAITRTVGAATRLSHVCSRFRQLVVSSPCLWDRVCPKMHFGAISSCFARCGRNAEVYFSTPSYTTGDLRQFMTTIIRSSKLWRRLVVDCDKHGGLCLFTEEIKRVGELARSRNLDVPFLTDLRILYPDRALSSQYTRRKDQDRIHFYSTWSIPRLHSMTTENLIPVPFSGSKHLRSLSIELSFGWYGPDPGHLDVRALASFFASCPALEEVALRLSECKYLIALPPNSILEMASVSNFNLRLQDCDGAVINSLLNTVHFPSVSTMKVEISANNSFGDAVEVNHGEGVLRAVFPDAEAFPNLRQLQLILDVRGTMGDNHPISFPFSSLPTLKHLELTTFKTTMISPPDGVQLPALRSFALSKCFALKQYWVTDLLRRIQEQRSLKDPLHFTVDGELRHDLLEGAMDAATIRFGNRK